MPFVDRLGYYCDVCGCKIEDLITCVPDLLWRDWLNDNSEIRAYFLCRRHTTPSHQQIELAEKLAAKSGRPYRFDYRGWIRMKRNFWVKQNPDWIPPEFLDKDDPIWK